MINKYQEALDKLMASSYDHISYLADYKLLQELVDKEIPKKILKPVDDNGEPYLPRGYGECSKCKTLVKYSNKYCHECGQRLEDEDD